jgi:hypothetical protein
MYLRAVEVDAQFPPSRISSSVNPLAAAWVAIPRFPECSPNFFPSCLKNEMIILNTWISVYFKRFSITQPWLSLCVSLLVLRCNLLPALDGDAWHRLACMSVAGCLCGAPNKPNNLRSRSQGTCSVHLGSRPLFFHFEKWHA